MPEPIIPSPTFDPVRVEITSPGTQHGRPFYIVDFVEADGCRDGMGGALPVIDLAADAPGEILPGTIH